MLQSEMRRDIFNYLLLPIPNLSLSIYRDLSLATGGALDVYPYVKPLAQEGVFPPLLTRAAR